MRLSACARARAQCPASAPCVVTLGLHGNPRRRPPTYWTGIGARVNFEKGNCYIAKATGEAPTEEHIPFDDVEGGYALRIQRKE